MFKHSRVNEVKNRIADKRPIPYRRDFMGIPGCRPDFRDTWSDLRKKKLSA